MREPILKAVIFKPSGLKWCRWLKMLMLELYIGDSLLEIIGSLSSYSKAETSSIPNESPARAGYPGDIEEFIPATFFTLLLKEQIVELLRQKFIGHYELLYAPPRAAGDVVKYTGNPQKLFLIGELRICYTTIWTILNIFIDVAVLIATEDLLAALATGGLIELIRRVKL